MAKHYNKAELLQMVNNVRHEEKMSRTRGLCTYATYANLMCSFMYHTYHWNAERLSEYCAKQQEYYNKFFDEPEQFIIQKKRITDFMGDKMWNWCDGEVFTEPEHISKNKAVNALNMKMTDINNLYMRECEKYFLAHYNAIIDYGVSVDELYKHFDKVDQWRLDYYNAKGNTIIKLHQELVDEVGIDIELPNRKVFMEMLNTKIS